MPAPRCGAHVIASLLSTAPISEPLITYDTVGPLPFCFFPEVLLYFLALSSSLSLPAFLSFLPSLLPDSRLSLPTGSHYCLAFPCFFLYPLCHLTISSGFMVAINVSTCFKPSRSLLPAPAFSLSQILKPYLSKTSSQDSHLLVSQMQFIQAGLPNILSKAQTQVFHFPLSQASSSLKFPL